MKKLTTLLLLSFLSFSLQAQTLECENASATFTNINCTDDYLSFMVTSTNSGSLEFQNLPLGYNWELTSGALNGNNPTPTILYLYADPGTYSVMLSNISNPGCGIFNLSDILIYPAEGSRQTCSDLNVLLNPAGQRPIPTLGQWGLIVLALILSISGITLIRRLNFAA